MGYILLMAVFLLSHSVHISVEEPISETTIQPESEGFTENTVEPESISEFAVSEEESNGESVGYTETEPNTETSSPITGQSENVESESEVEPEAESETNAEAESETYAEAENETNAEAENNTNAEAENGTNAEAENNTNAEAESNTNAEAENETNAEAESNTNAEAESNTYPEAESKTNAEAEGNTNAEGENNANAEAESNTGAEAEERPHALEIIGPPFGMIGFLVIGLLLLSCCTRRNLALRYLRQLALSTPKHLLTSPTKVHPISISSDLDLKTSVENEQGDFITDFDQEVLSNLGSFNNRPTELLRIATPALVSLFFCPFTLYMYEPLVNLFWSAEDMAVFPPDINEAIACFLAPAGLVYATSFGFAFQQALHKQSETLRKVTHELGLLDQIVSMAAKMNGPTLKQKMKIYRAVKGEAIFMALQIENREQNSFQAQPVEDVRVKIWTMMDTIRSMEHGSPTASFDLDRILADKIVCHMLELNSICSDRMGVLHSRIHWLKWAFLESLGFFSFFGILLIRAESYRMELIMCIITVFSISLMCYVVSDLDSPFSGFFKVDISVLPEVVFRARRMHDRAKLGDNRLCEYPEKG